MFVCVCGFVRPTLCTTSTVQDYIEGQEYFWQKAGKALKKPPKTGNATKNLRKTKKKFGRKPENAMFGSWKAGQIRKKSQKMENQILKVLKTGKG